MNAADGAASAAFRARFIALRTALFARGIDDPVLARFDSYTVPRATAAEVAGQLITLADSLAGKA